MTQTKPFFDIKEYHDYISADLAQRILKDGKIHPAHPDLVENGNGGGLETPEALSFLIELYDGVKEDLKKILKQRTVDRKFIDERTRACAQFNRDLERDWLDPDYRTVLGLEDGQGRVVMGPKGPHFSKTSGQPIAPLPDFLKGPHVTLFGPPDSAKMAVNAMNAYHRKLKNEPPIVEELLKSQSSLPKWGADDEDSKTPLRSDLVDAAVNLTACFEKKISVTEGDKKYQLASEKLAVPIKRIPGLALPCAFLFYKKDPIPLHLYDFALHLFRNWANPESLTFYVPKLENEEEAAYIHKMIFEAETLIHRKHSSYKKGSVRLMVVLENPRAILRTHEIMDALYPYFAGASLGWHDYLASTARLFKEDSNYRIPVKADPNIVIKYIKASHLLLADVVGPRGGIKVGGMYGILPQGGELTSPSFQITLKGYFKDVITQLKRNLDGFWVAHPDFVRIGLAILEGYKFLVSGNSKPLFELVSSLLEEPHRTEIIKFIEGPDIKGLDTNHPNYMRSLIVADIKESDFIANNHPDEIRYNVFQSLQYLTDWLCGNGCVALPTTIQGTPARVMDDLATAERSRWEVWHEIYHKRFALVDFIKIAHEEMNFIRRDLSNETKIVQVKWNEKTAKWYPVALRIMLQLMTAKRPVEFATELLMPFTLDFIRNSQDPWNEIKKNDTHKFELDENVKKLNHYFEICGVERFATQMAQLTAEDLTVAEEIHKSFSPKEILSAASFHGDIGQSQKTLDSIAAQEQLLVSQGASNTVENLKSLGELYKNKFGFKFLISAQGRGPEEILRSLNERLKNSLEQELENAKTALWEISKKRLEKSRRNDLKEKIESLRKNFAINGASIAIVSGSEVIEGGPSQSIQRLCFGTMDGKAAINETTLFQIASLSKTLASCFALEFFRQRKISLQTPVKDLLLLAKSSFQLQPETWAADLRLEHLMSHQGLNMHYVPGFSRSLPRISDLIRGNAEPNYSSLEIINKPGTKFKYSGGGFLLLEHIIETLSNQKASQLIEKFLNELGLKNIFFGEERPNHAAGFFDSGLPVEGGYLKFPGFAAGASGNAYDMAQFLVYLTESYSKTEGFSKISHDTAVQMLYGTDKGCMEFMGCRSGLGAFVAEAGDNKIALHQGANEGFRAIYLQCFEGPDRGKGFVILANGDNKAVAFNALVAQEIIKELKISGVDDQKFLSQFDFSKLPQEQIVNLGYKQLLFDAFSPTLPDEIEVKGPIDPLSQFNLAVGAKVLSSSNQKFARAENLLSRFEPVFDPELFCKQGKVMDSWESSRHNTEEFDTLTFRLSRSSEIGFVSLSTKYHDGNQAEFVRVEGYNSEVKKWFEVLPKIQMLGHAQIKVKLKSLTAKCEEIRVEMYPDGGLSRIGLYKDIPDIEKLNFLPLEQARCLRFEEKIPKSKKPLSIPYNMSDDEIRKNSHCSKKNLVSMAHGGKVVSATNQHYGPAAQVISPFPAIHMFDGLESARSREPNHFEEVILEMAEQNSICEIHLEFTHFINNNPRAVDIRARFSPNSDWIDLAPLTSVKAFAGNTKVFSFEKSEKFKQISVRTFPDGGINRIKVY